MKIDVITITWSRTTKTIYWYILLSSYQGYSVHVQLSASLLVNLTVDCLPPDFLYIFFCWFPHPHFVSFRLCFPKQLLLLWPQRTHPGKLSFPLALCWTFNWFEAKQCFAHSCLRQKNGIDGFVIIYVACGLERPDKISSLKIIISKLALKKQEKYVLLFRPRFYIWHGPTIGCCIDQQSWFSLMCCVYFGWSIVNFDPWYSILRLNLLKFNTRGLNHKKI